MGTKCGKPNNLLDFGAKINIFPQLLKCFRGKKIASFAVNILLFT